MKTCNFRGARPLPSPHHGLFLQDEPQIRYGMVQCRQRTCRLCFPSVPMRKPVVQFTPTQKHRFISGYEAILNCPTVSSIIVLSLYFLFCLSVCLFQSCETKNIIYALTCPCGQYDYIGYTSMTLGRRLSCMYSIFDR